MEEARSESFLVGRWLYLRGLALVYIAAFWSLGTQIEGLVGSRGLMPAGWVLEWTETQGGGFWSFPTLAWFDHSDAALWGLCALGILCAGLLFFRVIPMLSAGLCFLLFVSLCTIGVDFLGFQWDALLCEAGFLAILLAPPRLLGRLRSDPEPPRFVIWLAWWLVFRLMFSSGYVKLQSGDPSWRDMTALTYHFETQPLPTWTAWYMHQLPEAAHWIGTFGNHVVELFVPVLLFAVCVVGSFAPSRFIAHVRAACGAVFVALMVVLIATGNYAYFNYLTIVLCAPLVSDDVWRRVPRLVPDEMAQVQTHIAATIPIATVAVVLTFATCVEMIPTLAGRQHTPQWAWKVKSVWSPWRIANGYGLFRVMTKERPEIVLEGSVDGRNWHAYELPYKPGDPTRSPQFAAPHQPRLDWQMWFAALEGRCPRRPWFMLVQRRLLEGEPTVLELFSHNPFPDAPPKHVRAMLYDYRFATRSRLAETGAIWERELKGQYCPTVSRR